jgi:triosephosphate isomerase (TIM)
MSARRPLIAGNWKMNGSLDANAALIDGLRTLDLSKLDVVVCVPAPYLAQVGGLIVGTKLGLGAQTVSEHKAGAYTGESSAAMLKELKCGYVIVGHSERRSHFSETNTQVAAKALAAVDAGITPLVCVGETLAEREAHATQAVIAAQLDAAFAVLGPQKLGAVVIAYEPVWAIGTGKTATPAQAQDVHAFIRARVAAFAADAAPHMRILYGGSMKPDNARELLSCPDVDGGLIGGASLKAQDFAAICTSI